MYKPTYSTAKKLALFVLSFATFAAHATDWHYKEHGHDWGGLCETGTRQSPIDIRGPFYSSPNDLKLHYTNLLNHATVMKQDAIEETELNTGHSIQVNGDFGFFLYGNHRFEAKQFHFHRPSEHMIEGKRFPLEMHIVHQDQYHNVAVIAVFFEETDRDNPFIERLQLNKIKATKEPMDVKNPFGLSFLDKPSSHYLIYNGSFTTPPCTEGVQWFILRDHYSISTKQLKAWPRFDSAPDGTFRQPMPLNHRVILSF